MSFSVPLGHISAQTVRGALGLPDGLEALQSGGAMGTCFFRIWCRGWLSRMFESKFEFVVRMQMDVDGCRLS